MGSVFIKVLHFAILVRGGKCQVTTNHIGGRSRKLTRIPGWDELNSGHAEVAALAYLEASCESKKLQRRRNRCRLYSLACHYCSKTHTLSSYMAQPCRMCSQLLHEKGFTEVWYSRGDGELIHRAVVELVDISTRSFGERRLEWLQDCSNLTKAKSGGPLLALHLRDPASLEHVRHGRKLIEGRLWRGLIRRLHRGQYIYICCKSSGDSAPDEIAVQITFIRRYGSFSEMLSHGESLYQTLPDIGSVTDGVMRYNRFYRERDQTRYDAVAIGFRRLRTDLGMRC
jgi:ASC-1-like (ASCH) protein/tRNA(Arg) A34 adenosine deaminase TadA